MNLLAVGDVVSSLGCEKLRKHLPMLKKQYKIDVTVVNGENSADGNGITPLSAESIINSGADVITGGNHSFRRREIYEFYEKTPYVLRPGNYPEGAPGSGYFMVDKGGFSVAVISLEGTVYMPPLDCPFKTADRLIKKAKDDGCDFIFVDFHAEATSEKKALAYYLDGRVTAVVGTHTHIQTADCQLLPKGTAYITDLGMTGPENSVLGVKPELAIASLKDKLPVRFETASGECIMNCCIITADKKTGLATDISAYTL